MYSNKHAEQLAALENKATLSKRAMRNKKAELEQAIEAKQVELAWFSGFDAGRTNRELAQASRDLSQAQKKWSKDKQYVDDANEMILTTEQQMKRCCRMLPSTWLSRMFPSSKQKVAQQQYAELKQRAKDQNQSRAARKAQLCESEAKLKAHEANESELAASLQRYRHFDPLQAQAEIAQWNVELEQLPSQFEDFSVQIEEARAASERWESIVGSAYLQWKEHTSQLMWIRNDVEKAQGFCDELSATGDKHTKYMLHKQCEEAFGDGRPGHVLAERQKKLRDMERMVEKSEGQLRDMNRLFEKCIKSIIIDGNNLCYDNSEKGEKREFVGLKFLQALAPELCRQYKVTLWFDPAICHQLKMDETSLQAVIPKAAVRIAAKGTKADEFIVANAEFDANAYILSNDRFTDYSGRAAIREGRCLTYVVHSNSIQIQQLQINVPY